MTSSDLTKYSMTRSVARSLCDSWASCLNKCYELKQRFLHVWYGTDETVIDNAIDEWRGRPHACVSATTLCLTKHVTTLSMISWTRTVRLQRFLAHLLQRV